MAYNIHFIKKRKNIKSNQTNSSARILPISDEVSNQFDLDSINNFIDEARKTGLLTISNVGLTEIPSDIYYINRPEFRRIKYKGFNDNSISWWEDIVLSKLDLSSNMIKSITGDIKFLNNLLYLDLQDNCINFLPDEINEMQHLQHLNLTRNNISSIPKSIGLLEEIQHLFLGSNQLSELPIEFGKLLTLESLDLSNNKFESIPDVIAEIVKLRTLSLACNNIKDISEAITTLKDLTFLDVSQNRLTNFPKTFVADFEILKLDINSLTEFPIYKPSHSLKELYVNNNRISSLSSTNISYMPNIIILIMSTNRITELPNNISHLHFLSQLDISYNGLDGIPYELGFNNTLQILKIDGNPIRSIKRTIIMGGIEVLKSYLRSKRGEEQAVLNLTKKDKGNLSIRNGEKNSAASFEIDLFELNLNGILNLCERGLKNIPESFFESLKPNKIQSVQLSYNKLSKFPLGLLSFASTIVKLDLSYNWMLELPDVFQNFKNLEDFNLSGNYLICLPNTFMCLKDCLVTLNLAHNSLGQELPTVIYKLERLQYLNASNCSITNINALDLKKLLKLTNLDLSNNEIDVLPPHLGFCKQIKILNIDGNKASHNLMDYDTEALLEYLRSQIIEPS